MGFFPHNLKKKSSDIFWHKPSILYDHSKLLILSQLSLLAGSNLYTVFEKSTCKFVAWNSGVPDCSPPWKSFRLYKLLI